jgi:hypothetical protein
VNLCAYVENQPLDEVGSYGTSGMPSGVTLQRWIDNMSGFFDTIAFGVSDWLGDKPGIGSSVDKTNPAYAAGYATTGVNGTLAGSIPLNDTAKAQITEAGGTPVGMHHTHGNYSTSDGTSTNSASSAFVDDIFSPQDIRLADRFGTVADPFSSYLATPGGDFQKYDPHTQSNTCR